MVVDVMVGGDHWYVRTVFVAGIAPVPQPVTLYVTHFTPNCFAPATAGETDVTW